MKNLLKLSFFVFFLFGIGSVKAQIYVGDGIFINNFQPNLVTTNLNVGIGTNTPTEKLEVSGNILATAIKKLGGTASEFLKADGSVDSATYAPLASPSFTGIPIAPTATSTTNNTQVATTAFVKTANNTKANIASPVFTGIPAAPTAIANTNTTQLATTAFVNSAIISKANTASPTFTGNVGIGIAATTHLLEINSSASTAKITSQQGVALDVIGGNNSNPISRFTNYTNNTEVARFNSLGLNLPLETASTIASFDSSKNLRSLPTNEYPDLTELKFVKGLYSYIQGQLSTKQNAIQLTTTGTSGPATLSGSILNIPQYTVGSGGGAQTLQDVTTMGNTTSNRIILNLGGTFDESSFYDNGISSPSFFGYGQGFDFNGHGQSFDHDPNFSGLSVNHSSTGLYSGSPMGTGILSSGNVGGAFLGNSVGVRGLTFTGIGIEAYADSGTGLKASTGSGTGLEAYSYNGTGILAHAKNTNGVGIKVLMEDDYDENTPPASNSKGIVIASDGSASGNPLEITKSGVAKLVVNQQGEITATKFKIPNGAANQFLMANGTTSTGATASTIYNTDGTLSGARTVEMGANPINFNGTGNYIINAGNVGIGTTNPITKFHVEGDINATGLTRKIGFSVNDIDPLTSRARYGLTQLSNYTITGETNYTRPGVALSGYFGLSFFTGDSEAMRISDWGNVGIGTTTPQVKLDVEGGDFYLGENVASNGLRREFRVYGFDSGNKFYGSAHANYDNDKRTFDISTNNQTEQLKIDASSNANGFISLWPGASAGVGIGTLTTGSHKLAVEGTIGAREVKVYLGAWSDFVFKKDYNLPTLQEVETHIKDKGHLKDIPSEKEVLENGVKLGEMNSKLLQKVEELTLYLIQQNKDIEELKAQVKVLTTK